MKKYPHPLQAKFDQGEITPVNYWDIPDIEWNAKMALLDESERESANWYRQEKLNEKYSVIETAS